MKQITNWKLLASVACVIALLTGCGQKGDLYLLEENALTSWIDRL